MEDAQKYLMRLTEDLPETCFQESLTHWNAHDSSQSMLQPNISIEVDDVDAMHAKAVALGLPIVG